MGNGTEAASVKIPPHVLHRNAEFLYACIKFVIVGFTLGAADDFADFREEYVHRAHCLSVGVLLHVEGLDLFGIVSENNRAFEMFLDEEAFMLALEIGSPIDGEFEFVTRFLKNPDTFGVGETHEFFLYDVAKTVDQFGIIHLCEELEVIHAVVESVVDAVFDEILGEIHVVGDVIECHFRLYHPEFREVARSVGVFRAEGGTECVDRSESCGAQLTFELSADGECCGLSEEISREVNLAILCFREVVEVKGRYLKHRSGAFAVAGRDERGVQIEESAFIEKFMDGESEGRTHSEYSAEGVGSRTQMGDLAQEFESVTFFLERIFLGVGGSEYFKTVGLHFD